MSGDIPDSYRKDFNYLRDLSAKGALLASNSIYQSLDSKARNLPGLRRALDSLNVRY
ncbi:hypothetical protein [Rhodococcus sp. YH3-3]|uniref:hypothetical protein n=1 Tax=Rhodococcus sp. YH3-3 TaxID=1803579 RepID=UPI000ACE89B5|nr:hypothetical protein [Rhodococcus sp. YH3-3]